MKAMMSLLIGRNRGKAVCILAWQLTKVAAMAYVFCKNDTIDSDKGLSRRLNGDCVPIARSCSGFDMCDQHQLSIRMPPGHCANTQNAAECFLSPECRTSQP
ncbi:hypothetical protein Tco_1012817, partial [Tanacetum coccineum]